MFYLIFYAFREVLSWQIRVTAIFSQLKRCKLTLVLLLFPLWLAVLIFLVLPWNIWQFSKLHVITSSKIILFSMFLWSPQLYLYLAHKKSFSQHCQVFFCCCGPWPFSCSRRQSRNWNMVMGSLHWQKHCEYCLSATIKLLTQQPSHLSACCHWCVSYHSIFHHYYFSVYSLDFYSWIWLTFDKWEVSTNIWSSEAFRLILPWILLTDPQCFFF